MASELDALRARVQALENLCGTLYQFAGTVGAPVRFLDALAAGGGGKRIPKRDLLPVDELECEAVRSREDQLARIREILGVSAAAELGRRGGARTSRAKQRAAQENGRKGGRPRKTLTANFRLGGLPPTAAGEDPKMKIEY